MLATELNDEYLRMVDDHLERLAFRNGTLISAELGEGNKGVNYILRKPPYTGAELDGPGSGLDGAVDFQRQRRILLRNRGT